MYRQPRYRSAPRPYGRAMVRGRGYYQVVPARAPVRRVPSRAVSSRSRQRIAGNGKYRVFDAPELGSNLGNALGSVLGGAVAPGIGSALGGQVGGYLGKALGQGFRSLTGFGEYTIHENTLLYPDRVVPSFGDDSIRVRKREYIADISATEAFSNNVFPINPGLSDTFPWLSSIANNYEQYRFNGLVFQFVSTSSDAIASTTDLGLGQVVLATDYNAADAAYVNLPQMLGTMFSNSGKPSENIMHAIECAPAEQAQKLYYVRSGDHPEGTDIRMYDIGSFQLATQNMPAAYTGMGQLWVSYDITFCKSVQNNQLGFDLNTDKYTLTAPATTTAYFGTSRALAEHSNLGTSLSATVISFPPTLSSGYYQITYLVTGDSTAVVQPTETAANCTVVAAWANNAGTVAGNSGTTSTRLVVSRVYRIDARDATITYSGGTLPANATSGDLLISQINGEIFTG